MQKVYLVELNALTSSSEEAIIYETTEDGIRKFVGANVGVVVPLTEENVELITQILKGSAEIDSSSETNVEEVDDYVYEDWADE